MVNIRGALKVLLPLAVVSAVVIPIRAATAAQCSLPKTGTLALTDVPAGTSVTNCHAAGRVLRLGDDGLVIPEPGHGVGGASVSATGAEEIFQVYVSKEGKISYPEPTEFKTGGSSAATSDRTSAAVTAAPSACSDGAYSLTGTEMFSQPYKWYIGDGGMPGSLSQANAQKAFADAINNITGSYNDCGYTDQVSATSQYMGTTTYESDMTAANTCAAYADRDGKSTWDAGDLKSGTLARTCWWFVDSGQTNKQTVEADVRYNTADYDFTDHPSTCTYQYDVRAVGTHEAGHIFGLGHVTTGHNNLTMYTNTMSCDTKERTLGKGEILGLRALY